MQRVCLHRFPTKIAEHCLLFIAQPCVILQPSFLESSWFFGFYWSSSVSSWLIHCSSSVSFVSDSVWLRFKVKKFSIVRKRFRCDILWHVTHLVEHETYVFSRAHLKRDLRMNFKRTTCNKLYFLQCMFCFSKQFLYLTESLHVCFHSSFFSPRFWRGQTGRFLTL